MDRYQERKEGESQGMNKKANKLLGKRELVFALSQGQGESFNPERFRRLVKTAAQYGATHIHVGYIPFQYGNWVLPDNIDPYASWCNCVPSIFRVCPPKALQRWVPMKEAQRCRRIIRAQLEIMRPYGLKGTTYSVEPMWLPEGVYREHPAWRGAQCELGRIALRPYFTPNIDHPEVLELYKSAMKEYVTLFPEIDEFDFMSNDSGAGISWTPNIYPGMNGPANCRRRDGGERIANWLKAMQDGAAEARRHIRVHVHASGFSPELLASTRAKLRDGLCINYVTHDNESWQVAGSGLSSQLWTSIYPAMNLSHPGHFLAGLQSVYRDPDERGGRASVSTSYVDLPLAEMLLDLYLENPGPGLMHRNRLLVKAAEQLTGSADSAESLMAVWDQVDKAQHAILQIRQKGFGLVVPFCCVSMRWLTRPLVPAPDKLTEAETAHYRRFVFSPGDQKDNPNFGYVLGKGVFSGESVMWMSRWCLQEAIDTLQGAQAGAMAIAAKAKDKERAAALRLYAARIGVLACMAATVQHTIMYQYALDIAVQPMFGPNPMDYDDNMILDHRSYSMRKIAREELDNVAELIRLIQSQRADVIQHATKPAEENVFMLGPNPVKDLKRKMEIMLDHWPDYERLYPTCKVWEFEPEPRDNIVSTRPTASRDSIPS
jgi:hypothetical protein